MKRPKIDLYRPYDITGQFKPGSASEAKRLSVLKRKKCGACGHEYAQHNGSMGCMAGRAEVHDGAKVGPMTACYCSKFKRREGDAL